VFERHEHWAEPTVPLQREGSGIAAPLEPASVHRDGLAFECGCSAPLWICTVVLADAGRQRWAILASGGGDLHKIHLWDRLTGKEIVWSRTPDRIVSVDSLAFSPDSKVLAALAEMTVYVWDVQSAARVLKFNVPEPSNVIYFTPDGRALATAGQFSHNIRLWDIATGKVIQAFAAGSVACVAIAPDGRTLASGDTEGTVLLWDLTTGKKVAAPTGNGLAWVSAVAFSADGKLLACVGNRDTAFVYDSGTFKELFALRGHHGPIDALAFTSDGKSLATGGWDKTIRIWDLQTARERLCLKGHRGKVKHLLFSPDGNGLASSGDTYEQRIRLWDVSSGRETHVWDGHKEPVRSIAFSEDGAWTATGSEDGSIRLWPAGRGKGAGVFMQLDSGVSALALDFHGGLLCSATRGKVVRLTDAGTGKTIWTASTDEAFPRLVFTSGGKTVAGVSHALTFWDVASGRVLKSVPPHRPAALAFDGQTWAALEDNAVVVRDLVTLKQYGKLVVAHPDLPEQPEIDLGALAFSMDSKTLILIYRTQVQRYDIIGKADFRPFRIALHKGEEPVLALSPDANVLALGRDNGHDQENEYRHWVKSG
jgi:WD40 repeat protein